MNRYIDKIIDYHLNKRFITRIIFLFISSGIILISSSLFGQIFEEFLKNEYSIQIPDSKYYGIVLIIIGLILLFLDIKYVFLPSMFHTQKTTKIISLGNNRFQFIFEKKMRCTPSLTFIKPSYQENKFILTKWNENGFIIEFEKDKFIEEIDFKASSWNGLNFRQRCYIWIINLFRKEKLKRNDYANDFTKRQFDNLNLS
jgi:hypothetical protein